MEVMWLLRAVVLSSRYWVLIVVNRKRGYYVVWLNREVMLAGCDSHRTAMVCAASTQCGRKCRKIDALKIQGKGRRWLGSRGC